MSKYPIQSSEAGPPLGAYSQGWRAGDFIYVSGTGPIDPKTAQVKGESVAAQTELIITSIEHVLGADGASLSDCVKATVHLLDAETFPEFDEVYARRFPEPRPVRTTVGSSLRQVPGMLVEIDVVAYVGE